MRHEADSKEAESVAESSRVVDHNATVEHLTDKISKADAEVARLEAEIT